MTPIVAMLKRINAGIDVNHIPVICSGTHFFTRWDYERMLGHLQVNAPLYSYSVQAMQLSNIPEMEKDEIWLVDFVFQPLPETRCGELICLYVKPSYGVHVVELVAWTKEGRLTNQNILTRPAWESYESIRALASRLRIQAEDENNGKQTSSV